MAWLRLLRPLQWLKNLLIFFPPFLGGAFSDTSALLQGVVPLLSFSLASSATYVVNDIFDRDKDAHHPRKKFRPIASGQVVVPTAATIAVALAVLSFVAAASVGTTFVVLVAAYFGISLGYSSYLKKIPVADIFCIAAGFIIRLYAGGEAFSIRISEWLFLSVFLLALFLSTGKRYSEKRNLADRAGDHRAALLLYPEGFLESTMVLTGSAVLVTYTMYVISRHALIYTVPLCAFGLLRYLFRVQAGHGGDPTDSLLCDRPLLVVSLLWGCMVGWAIYGG